MEKNTSKVPMHFVASYIQNPLHPITVTLIGAGGNGGQMLSALARIHTALVALGKPGLNVTVWDGDTVEKPNLGRQLFSSADLGQNKAVCLVSRFNRFFGLGWNARDRHFRQGDPLGNVVITCVDNIDARLTVANEFRQPSKNTFEFRPYYWLDLGNGQKTGQCLLGSNDITQQDEAGYLTVKRLPTADEEFRFEQRHEVESGPSCSMAEALKKQSLFINSVLVQNAGNLLWDLFTSIGIDIRGFFVNLETFRMSPIRVTADLARRRRKPASDLAA